MEQVPWGRVLRHMHSWSRLLWLLLMHMCSHMLRLPYSKRHHAFVSIGRDAMANFGIFHKRGSLKGII